MDMNQNVLDLTKKLVSMPTVSKDSNVEITEYIERLLTSAEFEIERCDYTDQNGVQKANLIAKIGSGTGGLAFCSHSDVVPGQEEEWPAFDPYEENGNLFGRGSCDMKGPLAATIIAALQIDPAKLTKPVYIVVTSDEEIGLIGAKFVSEKSKLLIEGKPEHGVIAEPTEMIPVYAHKGFASVSVVATGRAAHTSTGLGESATFKIAPYLAEMAALNTKFMTDPFYQDATFNPPTNGFNIVIDDGGTASNVTASKTTVRFSLRTMPKSNTEDAIDQIVSAAEKYGFETNYSAEGPLYCNPKQEIVQVCLDLTGLEEAQTVPYGTDGVFLKKVIPNLVILGPGDISNAHTTSEYVPIVELEQAVSVYRGLIERLCQ